jgi:hypothetical protein
MMEDKNHIGWALATGALAIALGLALGVTFSVRTATSWLAFPRFLLSVFFLFVLPGTEIIRWCRLQVSPVEHLTLSVVLGISYVLHLCGFGVDQHRASALFLECGCAARFRKDGAGRHQALSKKIIRRSAEPFPSPRCISRQLAPDVRVPFLLRQLVTDRTRRSHLFTGRA